MSELTFSQTLTNIGLTIDGDQLYTLLDDFVGVPGTANPANPDTFTAPYNYANLNYPGMLTSLLQSSIID